MSSFFSWGRRMPEKSEIEEGHWTFSHKHQKYSVYYADGFSEEERSFFYMQIYLRRISHVCIMFLYGRSILWKKWRHARAKLVWTRCLVYILFKRREVDVSMSLKGTGKEREHGKACLLYFLFQRKPIYAAARVRGSLANFHMNILILLVIVAIFASRVDIFLKIVST